jgi:hypothetical protein
MNTLKKMSVGVFLGVLALASSAPARTTEGFGVTVPDLSVAMAEVSKKIAAELKEEMRKALSQPRQAHVRQSPTVSISEPIESLLVVASRLPAEDTMETVVVAATRLPIETIVVGASRLPSDPFEVASASTAQVRL